MKPFFVYLLRCGDGSYYAGHTDDLDARLIQHQSTDAGYTATRKPIELAWQGEFETREGALAFEHQIKGWSRVKKEALIRGDWEQIKALAKPKSTVTSGLRQAQPERSEAASGRDIQRREFSSTVRPELVEGLTQNTVSGASMAQRRAMAKAITLLESTRADHRALGDELLTALLPHTGKSFRLGISGVPGVGKSTFIEALGLYLIGQGHRVAVLTIDPSSTVSGGSILGDKTRMEHLSVHERAYIRPSPSSGTLGGVAEKTREAMLVCEAAGYDIVMVETVGVGQSETAVANMTDMFVLLQLPNAGDDLQAIKKGVMELADLVVINKADIDPDAATRARAQITSSLRLLGLHGHPDRLPAAEPEDAGHPPGRPKGDPAPSGGSDPHGVGGRGGLVWHPQVMQISALHNQGVDSFWAEVSRFRVLQAANGQLAARRQRQAGAWMEERIETGLKQRFRAHPQIRARIDDVTRRVLAGELSASTAARQLLKWFD